MATLSRGRRRTERAALDAALLDAAARADEDAVRVALEGGADVNAADDATGSTAVTCAIAGERCVSRSISFVWWAGGADDGVVHAYVQQLGGCRRLRRVVQAEE